MSGFMSGIIRALLGKGDGKKNASRSACLKEGGMPDVLKRPAGRITVFDGLPEKIRDVLNARKIHTIIPAIVAAVIIILFMPVLSYIKLILVLGIVILAGAISRFTQNLFPFVTGFDLCLFFTVIIGVKYGPFSGIVVGAVSSVLGSALRGRFDVKNMILPAIGYIIVGSSLAFFSGASMFYTGMAATLIYAASVSVMFWIVTQCASNTLTLFITTMLFNYWLFSAV